MTEDTKEFVYAGFWVRVWASIIDTFLMLIIVMPILFAVYDVDNYLDSLFYGDEWVAGHVDFWVYYVLPAVAVILFWIYRQATPGKMAIRAKIVDAETGHKPSAGQCIGRYFAYFPAFLFFGLGILWVGFDRRKQGWHDKLAGTLVIREIVSGRVQFKA